MEASRVLAVLDEGLEGLRLLSFVTPDILEQAEQRKDMLGEDVVKAIVKYRGVYHQNKGAMFSEPVMASIQELWRIIRKSPSTPRMQQYLSTDRSTAMLQVLSYFERLRQYARKRLTTTVEEDNSNKEYYEEVKERESKAVDEKKKLEQTLKLQRVELTKEMTLMQTTEDKAKSELHEVQTSYAQVLASVQNDSNQARASDLDVFQQEHADLSKELTGAKASLQKMRDEHKEAEGHLRKNKKRVQQDVEAVIGEYDADVGSKESEYQKALADYNAVVTQLEEYTTQYHQMKQEREEYDEKQRQVAELTLQENLKKVRMNRAARVIQGRWRAYQKAKKDAEKKRKKAEKSKAKK